MQDSDSNECYEGRWYVLLADQGAVVCGPESADYCQHAADEIEDAVPETTPIVVSRNGLVGFERAGEKEFTYKEHATPPSEVDGGLMGELIDAAFPAVEDDSRTSVGDGHE